MTESAVLLHFCHLLLEHADLEQIHCLEAERTGKIESLYSKMGEGKGLLEFDSELLEKKRHRLSLTSMEIKRKIENSILSHKEYTVNGIKWQQITQRMQEALILQFVYSYSLAAS